MKNYAEQIQESVAESRRFKFQILVEYIVYRLHIIDTWAVYEIYITGHKTFIFVTVLIHSEIETSDKTLPDVPELPELPGEADTRPTTSEKENVATRNRMNLQDTSFLKSDMNVRKIFDFDFKESNRFSNLIWCLGRLTNLKKYIWERQYLNCFGVNCGGNYVKIQV